MTKEELAYEHARSVGWNEAVQACARLVESKSCGECDYSKIYAREIRALDRSVQGTDD